MEPLFETVRYDLSEILEQYLFELNTEEVRDDIRHDISSYLDALVMDLSVAEYNVICDKYNNTPAVVDSHQLVVDVYIKPAHGVNFYVCRGGISKNGFGFQAIEDYDRAMRVLDF
jgi:hypothetical protein